MPLRFDRSIPGGRHHGEPPQWFERVSWVMCPSQGTASHVDEMGDLILVEPFFYPQ